jgi:phage gp29-like protein
MPPATVVPFAPRVERRPASAPQSWADVVDDRWTVGKVRAALTAHITGQFGDSARLVDAMLADDRVNADTRTRVFAVTGLPFRLEPAQIGDQRRAKAVAREVETLWPHIATQAVLHDLIRWSVLFGFSLASTSWETSARQWLPRLTFWHPQHATWQDFDRTLRVQTTAGESLVAPGGGTWVLHAPDGARPWMEGAVRGLAIQWLARSYAMRDQSRDSEKYGLHVMGAVVPSESDKDEKEAFFSDLRRLGSEGLVMLPRDREDRGFDVKYLDPGTPAWEGFERLIARCERSIATRILGQSNTASPDGGSYAKAVALDAIRQDLLESDARSLSQTLYAQVLRPWAQYNFGDADLAPRPVWDATPPADTASLATTHKTAGEAIASWSTAAAAVGLAVDVEALAQTYGVPLRRAPTPPAPVAPPAVEAPPAEALTALADDIDATPPQGVRDALRRGLELHAEGYGGDGLAPETVPAARRLARGEPISIEKARAMRAWFARHESSPGEAEARRDDKTSPAWVAWLLWGGDEGKAWASKIMRQVEAREAAASATLAVGQTYTDELVARGTASGTRAMRATLGALAAAIDGADSPEALRAALLSLLGSDDPAGLAQALARAQVLASLAGRYDVLDDL